jgi:hypothetical protein
MTTHTLYEGRPTPGSLTRLVVTARTSAANAPQARWLVQFTRWREYGRMLDQCAAWMPRLNAWDRTRWHPIGSRLVPPDVLADVEAWLRGRPVGEVQDTTTTEAP